MLNRIASFFSSLRLTVVLLGVAMILIFVGTIAQVKLGLYTAQSSFFRSVFIYWQPEGSHWKIPVFPGGWLLGSLLLINLVAAHAKRFQLSRKKIGIFMIHAGLILLLLGQFLTEIFQIEATMRLEEGETKNFTEDSRKYELAIVNASDPRTDEVVAIPESILLREKEIRHPKLPFAIRLKEYFVNSVPGAEDDGKKMRATSGLGRRLTFQSAPPVTSMEDENKPAALIELVAENGSLGDWTVTSWLTKHPWVDLLRKDLGSVMGASLAEPQSITVSGKSYQLALRPARYYKDHSIQLIKFSHDRYMGTDIPKNFSSRIHLRNPKTADDRDVLIFMNNPLYYAGETYYQGGFEPGDKVSILQVVRNPAWLTPYFSCVLVGAGLLTQFLMHLYRFGRRPTPSAPGPRAARRGGNSPKGELEPAGGPRRRG